MSSLASLDQNGSYDFLVDANGGKNSKLNPAAKKANMSTKNNQKTPKTIKSVVKKVNKSTGPY